jgi:hypothetical protein
MQSKAPQILQHLPLLASAPLWPVRFTTVTALCTTSYFSPTATVPILSSERLNTASPFRYYYLLSSKFPTFSFSAYSSILQLACKERRFRSTTALLHALFNYNCTVHRTISSSSLNLTNFEYSIIPHHRLSLTHPVSCSVPISYHSNPLTHEYSIVLHYYLSLTHLLILFLVPCPLIPTSISLTTSLPSSHHSGHCQCDKEVPQRHCMLFRPCVRTR